MGRSSNQISAFSDVQQPIIDVFDLFPFWGSHVIPRTGISWNNIGLVSPVLGYIMDSSFINHMLPHEVSSNTHNLDGIESTNPLLRGASSVASFPKKVKFYGIRSIATVETCSIYGARVVSEDSVDIIKVTFSNKPDLTDQSLFCGTAVEYNRT